MKAVSLFSGGLDSQLAVCLVKEQGIEVLGVNFSTPFFGAEQRTNKAAHDLGIDFFVLDIGQDYLEVLKNPVYGYGKNLNPCIDCHAFMLRKARLFMEEIGASFLITGEVLGQRPMSQNKSSLKAVEKLSGCQGFILRPLSALLLEPTLAEIEGWVDRSKLLDISGRSRSRQIELAKRYGIKDYPTPAGGCLLTQENFSKRLSKMLALRPEAAADDFHILKVGRHFYVGENHLLVIGRNQKENEQIESLAVESDYLFKIIDRPGPQGLLRPWGKIDPGDINLSAALVARYSDARDEAMAKVKIIQPGNSEPTITEIAPLLPEQVPPTV